VAKTKTLKQLLSECTRPSILIGAPELGDGQQAFIKHLTLAERILIDEIRSNKDLKGSEQLRAMLAIVAVNEDGSQAFDGPEDEAINLVPAALAERMVIDAIEESSPSISKAKKT
jgi:hypothetical protein